MRAIDADALIGELHTQFFYDGRDRTRVYAKIQDQPTVETERKRGKWILDDEYIDCSACKREKWSRVPYERLVKQFRFCPNCGADMRGEQDG